MENEEDSLSTELQFQEENVVTTVMGEEEDEVHDAVAMSPCLLTPPHGSLATDAVTKLSSSVTMKPASASQQEEEEEEEGTCKGFLLYSASCHTSTGPATALTSSPMLTTLALPHLHSYPAPPGGSVTVDHSDVMPEVSLDSAGSLAQQDKMVYMAVKDSEPEGEDVRSCADMTDEVYMEVIVGEEEEGVAVVSESPQGDVALGCDFLPVPWTVEYTTSPKVADGNGDLGMPAQPSSAALVPALVAAVAARGAVHKKRDGLGVSGQQQQPSTTIIIGPNGKPFHVHPCSVCGKKFKTRGFLKKHMKNHPEQTTRKKYRCTDCGYGTGKKANFHSHLQSHRPALLPPATMAAAALVGSRQHRAEMHKCRSCDYETAEPSLLSRHLVAVHSKSFPHRCPECGKAFRHPSELNKHVRIHTGEKPYACALCNYRSTCGSNLKAHVRCRHGGASAALMPPPPPPPLSSHRRDNKCSVGLLSDGESRQRHCRTAAAAGAGTFHCYHCGHVSFNSNALKRHVISMHTKDFPHTCAVCGKGFHLPSTLRKHAARHKDRRPLHECRHCGFESGDPFALSRHILSVHTKKEEEEGEEEDAALVCKRCHKSFRQRGELKKHMRKVHKCNKLYECEFCDYTTSDASGFKRHVISIHTKDYPHRCELCDKGFRRPSEKKQHVLKQHKDVKLYVVQQ
ncbi:zinc finger Y-chromosomal protein-like [Lampetra fluviatilis]